MQTRRVYPLHVESITIYILQYTISDSVMAITIEVIDNRTSKKLGTISNIPTTATIRDVKNAFAKQSEFYAGNFCNKWYTSLVNEIIVSYLQCRLHAYMHKVNLLLWKQ